MPLKRLLICLMIISSLFAIDIPFEKGFNLTWIWSNESPYKIRFSNYGKEDLEDIKSLGCDVIRLPLSLRYFTDDSDDRNFDPLFFFFLDQVVNWCEELEIYLILDNHTQFPNSSYVPTMEDMVPIWKQIAERYKDRSQFILYETFNEPHNISASTWKAIQDSVIKTIRSVDNKHTIVVKPIWDSATGYKSFEPVDDDNVIYSFHFYKPFIFTHQGASWTNPPNDLAGVPFPADSGPIPECPEELKGYYFEDHLANYHNLGTDSAMFAYIQPVIDFRDEHNVAIICDEMGVYDKNAGVEDRQRWHKVIMDYFAKENIPWTLWGYNSSFGIMKKGTPKVFPADLDTVLVENLGLIQPEKDTVYVHPDTDGFFIYHDFAPRHIMPSQSFVVSKLNFYSKESPAQGAHCIKLTKAEAYQSANFTFWAYRDLTDLVERGASLKFSMKVNREDIKVYPRFRMSNRHIPDDPNWRLIYSLNSNNSSFDGQWHDYSIPLTHFYETSEYVNGEHVYPDGRFSWAYIDMFGFYATGDKVINATFFFDNIRIELPGENVDIAEIIPENYSLHPIYPNPFNASSKISFSIPEDMDVDIRVYDVCGRSIKQLSNKHYPVGTHNIYWNAADLSSGIYFIRMQAGDQIFCRKAGIIK